MQLIAKTAQPTYSHTDEKKLRILEIKFASCVENACKVSQFIKKAKRVISPKDRMSMIRSEMSVPNTFVKGMFSYFEMMAQRDTSPKRGSTKLIR